MLVVKNLPTNAGDTEEVGLIPGLERSPGGRYGNSLQYLAWRISWTEEPGGLKSIDSQRVRQDWSHLACTRFSQLLDVEEIKNHLTSEKLIFNTTWVEYRLKNFWKIILELFPDLGSLCYTTLEILFSLQSMWKQQRSCLSLCSCTWQCHLYLCEHKWDL